jgi:hypothetical protein
MERASLSNFQTITVVRLQARSSNYSQTERIGTATMSVATVPPLRDQRAADFVRAHEYLIEDLKMFIPGANVRPRLESPF